MKSFSEMRQIAWKTAVSRWSFRGFFTLMFFMMIAALTLGPLREYYEENQIQTWGMFAELRLKMRGSGLDVAVASSRQFWMMTWASAFESFIECLVKGLGVFGLVGVALKAVRNEEKGWLGAAFGGFRLPLDAIWLLVLMNLRIFLWALLLVIPGLVAVFRYSMAWYVKVERPELSAGECLAESGRMMDGHKLELLLFLLSYYRWLLAGIVGLAATLALGGSAGMMLYTALMGYFFFLLLYIGLFGNAVFYSELKRISENKTETAATDVAS